MEIEITKEQLDIIYKHAIDMYLKEKGFDIEKEILMVVNEDVDGLELSREYKQNTIDCAFLEAFDGD